MKKLIATGIICFFLGTISTWVILKDYTLLKLLNSFEESENISSKKVISGTFGEIVVIDKNEKDFFDKISLNGQVISQNDHVDLELAFPNSRDAEFIISSDDCGGSGCGRRSATFIDVHSNPIFHIQLPMLSPENLKIEKTDENNFLIKGTSTYLENDLGDLLDIVFTYNRKNRYIRILPVNPNSFDYTEFKGKHPDELLKNENARAVFLKNMDQSIFKNFRNSISVSSGITGDTLGMIYSGNGIAPHSGGNPSAFFIIDAYRNQLFAGIFENGVVSVYTDMDTNNLEYEVVSELNKILNQYDALWDFETKKIINKE